ncbi:zinc-binding dehydrogenase [Lujinxingia litoralis]|uniref:Zinc-binding dehydrogenase n=1 Tax=Lujinxingia litoralis TaxID=2211119 RepID=A0A328CBB6_9DELT|nr:zinc-binding dehydrogenase [Lujinxingia litoralis]RAL25144.1 zinc-binding dehydrogenase [Lujinxingia litoralis]
MRAVRYVGPNRPFVMEDVPEREPAAGEVRVRIRAAGMCHTELHFASGLLDLGVCPVTMGHEVAGEIDAVGEGVNPERIGERVLLYYYVGCGECEWCERGQENLCANLKAEYGFFHDGGYAESIVIPERNAVRLPDHVSFEEGAPIACGVTTAIHASNLAKLQAGDCAVVYGVGAVGYGLVQIARLRGARVIAIGRTPRKLAYARELGADVTINAAEVEDVAAAVREATDGRGADVVFELVATKGTMSASTAMLAKRGRLIYIGYSSDTYEVHPIQLVINEVFVAGSVGNTLDELKEAVSLVAEGKVKTRVDQVLPLDRWQEGLDALAEGKVLGRVVLKP